MSRPPPEEPDLDPQVRLGGPADAAGAMRTWAAAHEARRGLPVEPEHLRRFRGHLGKPDAFLVVADDRGRIVGMALGEPALADDGAGPRLPGRCHVGAVFVEPDRWGRGLGGRLIDMLLAEGARRGYSSFQLWTQADNERALRLYAGRGFTRTGRSMVLDDERLVQLSIERPT